ncbi:hypothetical protein HUU40_08980 [candidate division KSB1 bacterium]|nr:hypothetical protein [candidate division KSB1 bacterium]
MSAYRLSTLHRRPAIIVLTMCLMFALLVSGCRKNPTAVDPDDNNGPDTPRTPVPTALVGAWYSGTVSDVNFYDRATGQFGSPSGTGIFLKLSAEGYYEKGVLLQSSLYNCTMTFFAYNSGTITFKDSTITLYPTYGRIKSSDNCVAENNYLKNDQLVTETIIAKLGEDEWGNETLWLRYPESNPSAFHRK